MVRVCRASRKALHCCCSAPRTPGAALTPAASAVPQNASASASRSRSSPSRSFVCAAALRTLVVLRCSTAAGVWLSERQLALNAAQRGLGASLLWSNVNARWEQPLGAVRAGIQAQHATWGCSRTRGHPSCSARPGTGCALILPCGQQLDPAAMRGVTGGLHGLRRSCRKNTGLASRHLRPPQSLAERNIDPADMSYGRHQPVP